MEMLLMGLCLSVLGLAVAGLAFNAAAPREEQPLALQPQAAKPATAQGRFFADPVTTDAPKSQHAQVPVEALLLQIENHIRLEQAAAQSFLAAPHADLLHSKTVSKFVN